MADRRGTLQIDAEESGSGPSRRRLIQRSAMVGGTVVWVAPAIESLAASPRRPDVSTEGVTHVPAGGRQVAQIPQ